MADDQDKEAFSWWEPLRVVNLIISIPLNLIGLMALLEQKVNWNGILQGLVDKYQFASRYCYDFLFGWMQFTPPEWFVDYLPVALTFYLSLNFSLMHKQKNFSTFLCTPARFHFVFTQFILYKFPDSQEMRFSSVTIFIIYVGLMLINFFRVVITMLLSPVYLLVMFLSKLSLILIGVSFFLFYMVVLTVLKAVLAFLFMSLVVSKGFSFSFAEGKLFEVLNYETAKEWLRERRKVYYEIKASIFKEIVEPLLFMFLNSVKSLHHSVDKRFFKEWVPVIGYQYALVTALALVMICLIGLNNVLR